MKTLLTLLLTIGLSLPLFAKPVTFAWDHDAPALVAVYEFYRIDGILHTLIGTSTTLEITVNAEPGQTFGVKAVSVEGFTSEMSATLTLSNAPTPPGKLRVKK
jgi:hypothetical protein